MNIGILQQPPAPQWRMTFGKPQPFGFELRVVRAPNVFHRWMQRVCLGIYWEPLK